MNITIHPGDARLGAWARVGISADDGAVDANIAIWPDRAILHVQLGRGDVLTLQGPHAQVLARWGQLRPVTSGDTVGGGPTVDEVRAAIVAGVAALEEHERADGREASLRLARRRIAETPR